MPWEERRWGGWKWSCLENKLSTVTAIGGEFDIPNLAPGGYTLRLNAVGYRLLIVPFTLGSAAEVKEFSITMAPDNFHHTDKVEVHGDVFQFADSPATSETNLTASEIRETSTVFADDPFRAVQTLPGVSAEGNNEFFAEFSVMGEPFSSVSIYVDDVLVQNPFHEIGNFASGASLGVLTSEVVEEMKLLPVAYPEQFGDAAGAALDIHTREGSRGGPLVRISAGIAASEVLAEGGLGGARKGSWLVSARKSYINYLIQNRIQGAAEVGFYDGDAKLNYDLTPHQNVNFFVTGGHTDMAMSDQAALVNYEYASGKSDFTLARAGWRWALSPRMLLDTHAAYLREPDVLFNNSNIVLLKNDHREWVGGARLTWAWAANQILEAGGSERQLRDSQYGCELRERWKHASLLGRGHGPAPEWICTTVVGAVGRQGALAGKLALGWVVRVCVPPGISADLDVGAGGALDGTSVRSWTISAIYFRPGRNLEPYVFRCGLCRRRRNTILPRWNRGWERTRVSGCKCLTGKIPGEWD